MEVLELFLRHFSINARASRDEALASVIWSFSQLPYENLTKIIKHAMEGHPEKTRRGPKEVIQDHIRFGTGGTCFSLTATLMHLLKALGWQAEPILADRPYGDNTHCALLIEREGTPHLIDPGYLILQPVSLIKSGEKEISTPFNHLLLSARENDKLELATVEKDRVAHRLTYKTAPADWGEFSRAWDDSFGWEMMRYPMLTRVAGGAQVYLRGKRFQRRRKEGVERAEIGQGEIMKKIAEEFRIDRSVVFKAIEVLKERGEVYG